MTRDMRAVRKANDVVLKALAKVERAKFALRIAEDELKVAKVAFEDTYNHPPQKMYALMLESVPKDTMIDCIKTVREITNLGLKESKDLVFVVQAGQRKDVRLFDSQDRALKAQNMLRCVGASALVEER